MKDIDNKETSFVSAFMFRYMPYWPLFVVFVVIGLAGAWAYLQIASPQYAITATVLIKDEKKGADESNGLQAMDILTSKKLVDNEQEVLHSRKLMKEVVNQLCLYAPVFEKGMFQSTSAYITSPIIIQVKNPDAIVPTVDDVPFSVKDNKAVIIGNQSYPLNHWVNTPYGLLCFRPNPRKLLPATHSLYFNLVNPRDITASLLANLIVLTSDKLSTVLDLTLTDEVPQRGEDILNRLLATYSQTSLDEKNQMTVNTLAFVDDRLKTVEKELDSMERQIQRFKSNKGVVDIGEQGRVYLANVSNNDQKMADLNMKLAVLDQVERYVDSKNDAASAIMPSTVGIDDPALTQMLQRLFEAKLEYEKMSKVTGEKNPAVVTIGREIEQIRPQILEKIQNQRVNVQASKSNLSATNGVFDAMLRSLPEKQRELTEISREQSIKNNIYNFLLQKREQSALAISSTGSDSKIVDSAESSPAPVSPRKPLIFLGAFVVSLGFAFGLVTVKELLNKSILFRSEIEGYTHIPIIAEISNKRDHKILANGCSSISILSEEFRRLRTAIGLYGSQGNRYKKILVTSNISGEGKSYISTNLAISLACSGKKVMLIDLDIRNPKTSTMMGVENDAGVIEFLEGAKQPSNIIKTTSYKNLSVIGAGKMVDNAPELILTGKLKELIAELENEYDYIVMDSSPVDPVSDAYIFSEYSDATLFVVRHGYTPKTMVQLLDSNSKIKALKNPLIVFNDIRPRGIIKGTYGYGYGYGYENVYHKKLPKGGFWASGGLKYGFHNWQYKKVRVPEGIRARLFKKLKVVQKCQKHSFQCGNAFPCYSIGCIRRAPGTSC